MVFGIIPGLGGIIGSGNMAKAASVRKEIMLFTWLIIAVLGPTVLLWNSAFIILWVGAEHYCGPISTLLIVMVVTQFVLIRNDANIIDLTLRLRRKVLLGTLSAILSLVVAGVLVNYFKLGIVGLCLGFVVGRSVLSFCYPIMVGRLLGVSFLSQIKGVLRPACVMVLFFGIASKPGRLLFEKDWYIGWIGLVFWVGVTLCVLSLSAFYAGWSATQRKQILKRVGMVIVKVSH